MARAIVGFGRLLRMGLASILFHRAWIVDTLDVNHIVCVSCAILRSATTLDKLENVPNLIVVKYPWNDRVHAFSGIPPYVSILQDISLVRHDQRELIDNFINQVKEALRQYGINGNGSFPKTQTHKGTKNTNAQNYDVIVTQSSRKTSQVIHTESFFS